MTSSTSLRPACPVSRDATTPASPILRDRLSCLASCLAVALALGACGRQSDRVVRPGGAQTGLPAATIAPVVRTLDFTRFVTRSLVAEWASSGRLDASWSYDEASGTWTRRDIARQSALAGSGGTTTEVRDETVIEMAVEFTSHGAPVRDLLVADHARADVSIRERRYAPGPVSNLDDPADVTVLLSTAFGLASGSADALVARVTIAGWSVSAVGGERVRVDYEGSARLSFDFPGHFETCPAERLTADVRVLRNGVALDRFTGAFGAGEGERWYTGSLASENGPATFGINTDRGCTAPVGISAAGRE